MTKCEVCDREIHVGNDCYQLAKGVLGTRDFINLESWLFCSEDCLEAELGIASRPNDKPAIPRPRRIP